MGNWAEPSLQEVGGALIRFSSRLARRWCAGGSPQRTRRRPRFREWGIDRTLGRGRDAPCTPWGTACRCPPGFDSASPCAYCPQPRRRRGLPAAGPPPEDHNEHSLKWYSFWANALLSLPGMHWVRLQRHSTGSRLFGKDIHLCYTSVTEQQTEDWYTSTIQSRLGWLSWSRPKHH